MNDKRPSRQRSVLRLQERARYDRDRAYLDSLKLAPCMDCDGEFPPYVMDFDHLGGKDANVSKLVGKGKAAIDREVAKCELVCANCHRIRTHTRKE